MIRNDLPQNPPSPPLDQKPVLVVVSAAAPQTVLARVEYLRHMLRLGLIAALLLPALT